MMAMHMLRTDADDDDDDASHDAPQHDDPGRNDDAGPRLSDDRRRVW